MYALEFMYVLELRDEGYFGLADAYNPDSSTDSVTQNNITTVSDLWLNHSISLIPVTQAFYGVDSLVNANCQLTESRIT